MSVIKVIPPGSTTPVDASSDQITSIRAALGLANVLFPGNLKTINGQALAGSGDIAITGGSGATSFGALTDAGTVNLPATNTPLANALAAKVPATRMIAGKPLSADVALAKVDVGLANVDNTADNDKPISALTAAALTAKIPATAIGNANGVAPLNSSGQVPSANLPSYVDDVLEFANYSSFPTPGETGKIFVSLAAATVASIAYPAGQQWRWSGSAYTPVIASPGTTDNVPEGSGNVYFTAARARAAVVQTSPTAIANDSTTAPNGAAVTAQLSAINAKTVPTLVAYSTSIPLNIAGAGASMNGADGAPIAFSGDAVFTFASSPAPVEGGNCEIVVQPNGHTLTMPGTPFGGNAFDGSGNFVPGALVALNFIRKGQVNGYFATNLAAPVVVPAPVFIDANPWPADQIVGVAGSYQLSASNANSYSSSSLPPGVTLSSGGLLAWTFTAAATYSVPFTATGAGGTASSSVTVRSRLGVIDNFLRPDSETTINPRSDGGTWTVPDSVLGISNGALYCPSGAAAAYADLGVNPTSIEFELNYVLGGGGQDLFHFKLAAGKGVFFLNDGNGAFHLYTQDAGNYTNLANASGIPSSEWARVKILLGTDGAIVLFVNEEQKISITFADASYTGTSFGPQLAHGPDRIRNVKVIV